MIRLSNGHEFEYMAASGALAFDGRGWFHERFMRWISRGKLLDPSLFTVVAKTVTYKPRKGNYRWYCPWKCIYLVPNGVVNAVGLTNKGIRWWAEEVGVFASSKIALVGSILEDIEKLRKIGAKAISFGSIFLRYPWRPTLFVREDMKRNQI